MEASHWKVSCEMMWSLDPNVEAARKLDGWREFHRACGDDWLYFDHVVRETKRSGPYFADAYTLTGNPRRTISHLHKGQGKTVVEAIADAYRNSGIKVPIAEPHLDRMLNPPVAGKVLMTMVFPAALDDLLGGEPVIDMEDLLG